jgi:hypothetical protein
MPRLRRDVLIAGLAAATMPILAPLLGAVRLSRADSVAKKPAPPPAGPDAKPEEIVRNLYDRYLAEVYDYMDEPLRIRYFSQATDALLKKVFDKSKADDEPGIDYEPLIDGQDGEVKGLVIATTLATPTKATVEARFTSYEDKTIVIFDFLLEKTTWKIEDIRNKEGNSLKAVAKDFLQ